MKIICYGDSNTYGYDPRTGGRYDSEHRWVDILCKNGYEAVNEGENGREVPYREIDYIILSKIISRNMDADLLLFCLGTNDVYNMPKSSPVAIGNRIRNTFKSVFELGTFLASGKRIVIVSPPVDRVTDCFNDDEVRRLTLVFKGLSEEFRTVAEEVGAGFIDTAPWKIPFSFDGCHLSEPGHILYAEGMLEFLNAINR